MLTEMINIFKDKIKESFVIGPFSKTKDPAFIECMGYSGFDFVIIDLEHGPNNVENIQNLIRAAQISNVFPIVRIKEDFCPLIGEVLDIGIGGIQVPKVTSIHDVKTILKYSKFHPEGERGVCRYVRAANYSSLSKDIYFKEANNVIIIQIEGVEAIKNLDEIINFGNFDILFIGPYDLSQSLGVTGQVNSPIVVEKIQDIVNLCKGKDIVVGTFVENVENALKWIDLGVKYICYSVDVGIFSESSKNIVNAITEKHHKGISKRINF